MDGSVGSYVVDVRARGDAVPAAMRAAVVAAARAAERDIMRAWEENQFGPSLVARYGDLRFGDYAPDDLRQRFLRPLLRLACAWVRTRETRFRDVYLDERLRYSPHRESAEVRAAFFRDVLAADEAAFIGAMPSAEVASAASALLAELHRPAARRWPRPRPRCSPSCTGRWSSRPAARSRACSPWATAS